MSSRKTKTIRGHLPVSSLLKHRVSNSDMNKIKHGQVFLLEYGPHKSNLLNKKRMLVKLHDAINEGGDYMYFYVILENTEDNNWSPKNNDQLTSLINSLHQSFKHDYKLNDKTNRLHPEYPNLETTDVNLLELVSNPNKFNLTFMPIETIMGNKLNMSKKEEYKKILNDLIEQRGNKKYISTETWDHIMSYLTGELNSKNSIRGSLKSGGKRTRSRHVKKNRLTKYKH
jgi:hypothetical protein